MRLLFRICCALLALPALAAAQDGLRIPADGFQEYLVVMPIPVVYAGSREAPENSALALEGDISQMANALGRALHARASAAQSSKTVFLYQDETMGALMAQAVPSTHPLVMVPLAEVLRDRLEECNATQHQVLYRFLPGGVSMRPFNRLVSMDCRETSMAGLLSNLLAQQPCFRCRCFVWEIKKLSPFMKKQLRVENCDRETLVELDFMYFGRPEGVSEEGAMPYRAAPILSSSERADFVVDPRQYVADLMTSDSENARSLGYYLVMLSDDREVLCNPHRVLAADAPGVSKLRVYNSRRYAVSKRFSDPADEITTLALETSASLSDADLAATAVTLGLMNSPVAVQYLRSIIARPGRWSDAVQRQFAEAAVVIANDRNAVQMSERLAGLYSETKSREEIEDMLATLQSMPVVSRGETDCAGCIGNGGMVIRAKQ